MDISKAKLWGVRFGLYFLVLYIPVMVLSGVDLLTQNLYISYVAVLAVTVANVCYLFFVRGLLALAHEHQDVEGFPQNLKALFVATIAVIVLNLFIGLPGVLNAHAVAAAGLFVIIVNVILGVINLRLARNFHALEGAYGARARLAAKWSRIAGWLMVTILFAPIGVWLSALSDLYAWKMLKRGPTALTVSSS